MTPHGKVRAPGNRRRKGKNMGTWKVYKWTTDQKWKHVLDIPNTDPDVWGDDLYTEMESANIIEDISHYDVEGDNQYIAVMGKEEKYGEYQLRYTE